MITHNAEHRRARRARRRLRQDQEGQALSLLSQSLISSIVALITIYCKRYIDSHRSLEAMLFLTITTMYIGFSFHEHNRGLSSVSKGIALGCIVSTALGQQSENVLNKQSSEFLSEAVLVSKGSISQQSPMPIYPAF